MKANPGGQLAPDEVMGRDALIRRLWTILQRQSLVLASIRRIGKTSVLKKMAAECPSDVLPVYRDLEGLRTPLEFVDALFKDVEDHLSLSRRTASRARSFLSALSGTEIGHVVRLPEIAAPHWKALLTTVVEDLVAHCEKRIVFFWDEVPMMLYNIRQYHGEPTAMELLDSLRSLRQMNPDLRMVFTGSIGMHNVISSLRRRGYANDPTNDMAFETVPPLDSREAEILALALLRGEAISTPDDENTASAIASAADNIPHYIHHLVDQLQLRHVDATPSTVSSLVLTALVNPDDPWHLHYYRSRIDTYYEPAEREIALALLDAVAASDHPVDMHTLIDNAKAATVLYDDEAIRDVLILLLRDHYFSQTSSGAYAFLFPLIKRWWKLSRGIA